MQRPGTLCCVVKPVVQRLAIFYVTEYNEVIPRGAFDRRTPNEGHFGRAEDKPIKLDVAQCTARVARLTRIERRQVKRVRGSRLRRLSSKKQPDSESEVGKSARAE